MFETVRQNSAYRSVRYSTIRKDAQTADKSNRLSQFRVKRKLGEESTFYKTRTIELKPQTAHPYLDNPEQSVYMETFNTLFQSEKKVKEDDFQGCDLNIKFRNFDGNFVKDPTSEFTLLDPFHRPYSYLTAELTNQEKELKQQKDDLRSIRAQLNILNRNTLSSLRNSQQEGKKGIELLRQMLRKNEVESQETRMRVRREVTELYEGHDNNLRLEEQLSDRSRRMQRNIFSCEPFELQLMAE